MPMFGAGVPGMRRQSWQTPGIGDGQPQNMPAMETPDLSQLRAAPSFFSRGGAGVDLLGGVADGLLAAQGMAPVYAPFQAQRRQVQQAEVLRQRQRAEENADWAARQDYERAHPTPRYFEANNGDQYRIGADGQPERLFADPTPKVTWTQVDLPNGQKQLVPSVNGQIVGAPAATPASGGSALPAGFTVRGAGGAGSGPRSFPLR